MRCVRPEHGPDLGIHLGWGGRITDMRNSNGVFPYPYGLSASGLAYLGGAIKVSELKAGQIDHVISVSLVETLADVHVPPASRNDGRSSATDAIAEGTRFRLDPTIDVTTLGLAPAGVTIARALQRYGMVVTDTSGAAVPGATVTLTNQGTGLVRTIVTDNAGEYTAPSLPTGKYKMVAELPGFKTATASDIELTVDTKVRVNARLEVGTVAETVTVAAASPLVQVATSELGTTVQEEQIKTLPLNGRNFVNLTRTVPGVVRGIPGANIDGAGSLAWRGGAAG